MPDLFFGNEKESHFHDTLMPNVLVYIFPSGAIQYSIRISLTLSCPMDFKLYPFDRQYCPLRMSSCTYCWITWKHLRYNLRIPLDGSTTNDLVILWKEYEPVQVSTSSKLSGFTLKDYSTDYCPQISTGEYSCLKVNFAFDRALLYYVIQIYIPCSILVLTSFVSFWLDPEAITARVLLGKTFFLSIFLVSHWNITKTKLQEPHYSSLWL